MAEGKFIAYYRVSTERQGRSGLGLDAQRAAVADYLNGGSWELLTEFVEIESGRKSDRPQLAEALKACKKQKAILVIAKLDRLARNVAFIANLMEAGVEFIAVDFPQANRLTLHILSAVAEHEARMISARTKAALQSKKKWLANLSPAEKAEMEARGERTKLGGPKLAEAGEKSREVRMAKAAQRAANLLPVIRQVQAAGAKSYHQIANALNERNVPTLRGGPWHAMQVRNVLLRAA